MSEANDQRLAEAQHVYDYMPSDDDIAQLTSEKLLANVRGTNALGIRWLDARRGNCVLELGCGSSYLAPVLAIRGVQVVGCDINAQGIEVARKISSRSASHPAFVLGDAVRLPFTDAVFDAVYGIGVLHHLPLEPARDEILRVLKPGGKAFFVEPLIHNPLLKLYRTLNRRKYTPGERPLSFQDVDEWCVGFSYASHSEYQLLAILAHLIRNRISRIAARWLEAVDSLLDRGPRAIRKQFRYVMIRLTR